MVFTIKAPAAPVPIAVISPSSLQTPLVNAPAANVKEAEPITVEPHLYFIVRESATAGRVKNPFATTCINAPLVKVLAGIVLLPTPVPIREVSLAVLVAAALVVEEKKVEPDRKSTRLNSSHIPL